MAAYPIRPYDAVMQAVAKMIANGQMDCEYIVAEGEHSQFEIVKHACAVGARAFAGSSGVGWFYAFEAIAVTAGLRLPIVANVGNRALDDPGAFGVEHNDALAVRDLGWLLAWVETAQEAFDHALIAYRVAEDRRMSLPCAISIDGAFLTHSQHLVKIPTQEAVDQFLPAYDLGDRLFHPDNPITIAPQVDQDWLMEIRKQNDAAMRRAPTSSARPTRTSSGLGRAEGAVHRGVHDRRRRLRPGRPGHAVMPVRVLSGGCAQQGNKVGFVRLKWFRPFPAEEMASDWAASRRSASSTATTASARRTTAACSIPRSARALYDAQAAGDASASSAGLGGREVTVDDGTNMFELVEQAAAGDLQTKRRIGSACGSKPMLLPNALATWST